MTRALDTATLDAAAKYYAAEFIRDRAPRDRDWVISEFYKFAYKDAFGHLLDRIRGEVHLLGHFGHEPVGFLFRRFAAGERSEQDRGQDEKRGGSHG